MQMPKWRKNAFALSMCWLTAIAAHAQDAVTVITIHSFDAQDGNGPTAPLLQGVDGDLYGTTTDGGANGCSLKERSEEFLHQSGAQS